MTITIKGDYTVDGFRSADHTRFLTIAVIDGVAYDAELLDVTPADQRCEAQVKIDADGALRAWGDGVAFLPNEGEIERVGLEHFQAA